MNENFSHTEDALKKTADSLVLSVSEKNSGREKLRAHLATRPLPVTTQKRSRAFLYGFRSVFALLLIVLMGSGAASAAEGSLPGNVLYPIKTRITEPVRAAFSLSPQARSEFETERVHRRLSEYAHLVTEHDTDDSSEELARSLATHVEKAKEAIAELSADGEESDALVAANDLRVTLLAHAEVLQRIEEQEDESVSEDDSFERALGVAIAESENIASSSQAVLSNASDEEVAEALDEQEENTDDLANAVTKELSRTDETFDAQDAEEAQEELAQASVLIEAAKEAEAKGSLKEALLLYADAHEKLGELTILIEADTELGLDVITEDEEDKEDESDE